MTETDPSPRRRPILFAGIAIAAVLLIAVGIWWIGRPAPVPPVEEVNRIDSQDAARLIEQKNVAVGLLENLPNDETNDGAQCVTAFEELSETLSDELLGPRDLVIARLLMLDKPIAANELENIAAPYNAAEAALQLDRDREGDTFEVRMLAAQLAKRAAAAKLIDNLQPVVAAYRAAAELSPDDPMVWSELYLSTRDAFDEASRAASREALQRAYELRPNNLVLLTEWLLAQAEAHDPEIVQTLTAAKEVLQPLAASLQQRGVPLDPTIDEAIAAAQGGDANAWGTVMAKVRPLVFVVRPDPAYQLDRPRLERHVLEYVIDDFSPEFYERADLEQPQTPEAIPVEFVAAPQDQQLPVMAGVKDVITGDFDLDGRLDVAALDDERVVLYSRGAEGDAWISVAEFEITADFQHVLSADFDRDEDLDLIIFGAAGVEVLNNQRENDQLTFAAVSQDAVFDALADVRVVTVADLEHDGDLDLIVGSGAGISLWSNHGDLKFADVSGQSSFPPAGNVVSAIVPVDWNRDVAVDLIVAHHSPPSVGVLENVFHNRFRWRPFEIEPPPEGEATSLRIADIDGNASWDLLLGGDAGIMLLRTDTEANGRVRFLAPQSVSQQPTGDFRCWDYDNDGFVDLASWGDDGLSVHRGGAGGEFQQPGNLFAETPASVSTVAVGDVDRDGDEDLLVASGDQLRWFLNEGGNANHWIDITLKAESDPQQPSQRTNTYGIGSLLELKTGPRYQAKVVAGQLTHFGIGQQERADVLRVLFTNGIPQNVLEPAAGQLIVAEQRILKGSCPYLYTWTGERYEFFTDLLWSAPIGLQFAEGVLAPAREWEYLLVPGERLVEQDGEYRVQITEELWEAAYFDEVKLIAVDHPAEIEVYSNEKVGPAEIAEFKVHTVRNRQSPVAAHDQQGRDVLPLIAERDDRYLKAYDRRFSQGVTEEQAIELDLGEWENPQSFTLFLTGWVFPSDTSLNVSISQDPSRPSPQPPSLWVPDGAGDWKRAMPYTGFPGGKTKTIAIEMPADLFTDGDFRVRLVTTMQLNWDEMFFTVDEAPAEYRLTEMPPRAADLHPRGFSRRIEHPGHGPESYDYADVSTDPRWPPMRGSFTRYGDVTELIGESDDLLVVMGAGDEMIVRFVVPPEPPPAGWKRDFLIYNVGWDKDADLNTVLGQTVEPLPFRAMKSYPYPPGVVWPDTPRHQDYLETYQTREQSRGQFWRWVCDSPPNSLESD